ncbi:helix-turn-helix domain-containing protein [Chryseosolibacter indicus]|uniref:Helix-turn-helix transcriptional regulator n=1 Tax=Chryseosolibacter indicus TaxID=2782351 RepID=A0ABS5VUA2_9BACT|nr:helix-turn-helix transcriptional regulator [Chryseosolibacter indicus]MBT1704916.1 helix-turn-helix transcriptional regulator [Chryseosolibacter indicus]
MFCEIYVETESLFYFHRFNYNVKSRLMHTNSQEEDLHQRWIIWHTPQACASKGEVALACKMDTGNYSRIENGKTDPAFSSVVKIAKAMDVELIDLFQADQVFKDVNSFDKSLAEKLAFIEQLNKKDKIAFYAVLDAFIGKKKLKDALSNVLSDVK